MAKKKKSKKDDTSVDLSRKKKKEFDIDTNIKVAYKTGKVVYGKNQVLRGLRENPFKMLIIAYNCPKELESQLKYYNSLLKNKLFIYKYKGSSWDLGLACAKPYMISAIGIIDQGDSDLLSLKTKRN
ncbi:MAG: 50S ribosomal protein L30e [Promethearchaeota archaeon]